MFDGCSHGRCQQRVPARTCDRHTTRVAVLATAIAIAAELQRLLLDSLEALPLEPNHQNVRGHVRYNEQHDDEADGQHAVGFVSVGVIDVKFVVFLWLPGRASPSTHI